MNQQAYFVTGTDTEVGKTLVAAAFVHKFVEAGFKAIGMKPVAAGVSSIDGMLQNEDVSLLRLASNVNADIEHINPYLFELPIAPHIAAEQVGKAILMKKIETAFDALKSQSGVVIVEGAGGFLVPLNATQSMADIPILLQLPVILVVGMRLGCLNHTLLTVEAIQRRGLKLAGWVANVIDPNMSHLLENIKWLEANIHAPFGGIVPWMPQPDFKQAALHLRIP